MGAGEAPGSPDVAHDRYLRSYLRHDAVASSTGARTWRWSWEPPACASLSTMSTGCATRASSWPSSRTKMPCSRSTSCGRRERRSGGSTARRSRGGLRGAGRALAGRGVGVYWLGGPLLDLRGLAEGVRPGRSDPRACPGASEPERPARRAGATGRPVPRVGEARGGSRRRRPARAARRALPEAPRPASTQPQYPSASASAAALGPKLSRNAPCWCGSGKRYKRCHMPADETTRP